jgi:signal transduction histidine kinase
MAADRPPRRTAGVRVRTTLLATVVVAATLALGGVLLVTTLRAAVRDGVEESVERDLEQAVATVDAGRTPTVIASGDDDTVAQVLDGDGRVVATSPGAELSDGALLAPGLAPGDSTTIELPDGDAPYVAAAAGVDTDDGPRTVVVASTLESLEESSAVVTSALLVGLPIVTAVVAAVTWLVVGRALAPVDEIRRTADAVTATDLSRRVPEPRTGDEVARLARTVNSMLERLEQSQRRQRRLVSDASHELRSPIATIRQHAEVARLHPATTDTDALAGEVLAEAARLERLVDDLLVLARADEGALHLRRRPVELDDVVLDEARRVRATTDLAVDARTVSAGAVDGDVDALRRVVRNVVDNATRHARGRVALSVAEADGTVTLAVEDDGPGVPEADRDRAFERFVRLDEARARTTGGDGERGTGLGLAIVAELVAAHGGRVAMTDAGLGGTRVEITLPAHGTGTASTSG